MKRWSTSRHLMVMVLLFSQSYAEDDGGAVVSESNESSIEPKKGDELSFYRNPSFRTIVKAGDRIEVKTDGDFEYRFIVTVNNMTITRPCGFGGDDDPKLKIIGGNNAIGLCENFNFPVISPKHMYEMTGPLVIEAVNWTPGDNAWIYVSIYYEVDVCDECTAENGGFCCTECSNSVTEADFIYQNSVSDGYFKELEFVRRVSNRARCIPLSLTCNGRRNCGHSCTEDEDPYYCSGMYNWNMSVIWTTLLAVVFFVITPAAIVFLVCYNNHLNVLRRNRRSREDSGTMEDPPNDLPPSYEDVVEPPPCFCTLEISETTGTDNPAFDADASQTGPRAPICNCTKKQIP